MLIFVRNFLALVATEAKKKKKANQESTEFIEKFAQAALDEEKNLLEYIKTKSAEA